ncbi:MAG TPA: AbrB/MazE/SpoVT family DNA-binding domain-containing protein [Deltaproteobacteria bacterium]|nr:AbrB/MazE/SpoVT family DNA-binding domain-containing protein [Deltaproteobacteria bacterium]
MPIRRKIVRTGKGSFCITLPKDWVVLKGLREGDFVLLEVDDVIVIKSPKSKQL